MTSISTTPFHVTMLRKANIWYSARDGNFNDPTTWLSNGRKKYSYPQSGDTVYVNHTVTVNMTTNVKNVYVAGTLKFSNSTLTINGDLQVTGTLDHTGINSYLNLKGVNNAVNVFLPGPTSTIEYSRLGDQDIMDLSYFNLSISGGGNKYIYGELTINGNTNIGGTAVLYSLLSTSKITFVGFITNLGYTSPLAGINNLVNADIELNSGINIDMRGATLNLGTGNIYLNGLNVQLSLGGATSGYLNYNNITIKGSSIATVTASNNTPLIINGTINGESSNSTLRIAGHFFLGTPLEPMLIGNYSPNYASTSVIGYIFNGNYNLPYTTYSGLTIRGSGIKTCSGDTTISGQLSINSSGTLELAGYDFTVAGATSLQSGLITKNTVGGYTVFKGNLAMDGNSIFAINTSSTIELQNSLNYDNSNNIGPISFANGSLLKFTTRNQTIDNGHIASAIWNCDILISGAITVTNNLWGFGITGSLNGDNASSTFNNIGKFTYSNSQQPMATGILSSNLPSSNCIFIYNLPAAQNITGGSYANLTLSGNGIKTILGNISVSNTYLLLAPATLSNNGFTLTNP